jgi:predicted MFS family arabinose efflux permease
MTVQGIAAAQRERAATNGRAAQAALVYLGFSLQLLQVGIIPLLPLIGKDLGEPPGTVAWLVTASLLSGVVFLAVLSRLADLIGKRVVVLIALALVLAGSLIGCVADGFGGLVVARVLMGAVLPMLALPEAIAADTMPRERAQFTIGAIHAGTGLGISGGLLLGALAGSGEASWRSFFVVGAIASAVGIAATIAVIRDAPERARGGLDVLGATLLAGGLVALLLALTEGGNWGWGSFRVLGLAALGLVLLAVWFRQQSRTEHPLVSVRFLLREEVRIPFAMTFLVAFGIYGALSAVTRLAQTPEAAGGYGFTAAQVAWYALPQGLGSLVGLVLIRRFVPRERHAAALALGCGLIVVSFVGYALLVTHPGGTLTALLLDSAGLATTLAVTQIVVVRSVTPAESGIALGLTIVMYAIGNTVGSAVVQTLFSNLTRAGTELPSLAAYRWAFALSGLAALAALALCAPLARRLVAR